MPYDIQTWLPRLGTGLNKYKDQNDVVYEFSPYPDSIAQEGTPFSATAMNHMEQGIKRANSGGYVFYGECGASAATAAKTVTISNFTADHLTPGTVAAIKFINGNTSPSPTLNVNSTGAKSIICAGRSTMTGIIDTAYIALLQYDGTYWQYINPPPMLYELTRFTSSGNFIPANNPAAGNRYKIMLLGAGGGGYYRSSDGAYDRSGGAGAMIFFDVVVPPDKLNTPIPVTIGAAAVASDGGDTKFGEFFASGGKKAPKITSYGEGGSTGFFTGESGILTRGGNSWFGNGATSSSNATGYGAGGWHDKPGSNGLVIVYAYV